MPHGPGLKSMDAKLLHRLTGRRQPSERGDTLNWQPLRFLGFYRLVLAGFLVTFYFIAADKGPLGQQQPTLFASTGLLYVLFALAAGFAVRLRWPAYRWQTVGQVLVDILAITLLMHASGGLSSGLGILLLVTVAAGSLLVPGRMAFLFAAIATLAVFGEYGYALYFQRPATGWRHHPLRLTGRRLLRHRCLGAHAGHAVARKHGTGGTTRR